MNKQRPQFIFPSVFSLILIIVLMFSQTRAAALAPAPAADKSSMAVQGLVPVASGWTLIKFPQGQPLCTGVGFLGVVYYDRLDCGFGYMSVSETTSTSTVKVSIIDSAGVTQNTQTTTFRTAEVAWEFDILPTAAWAAGPVTIRVTEVNGVTGNFGETMFFLNQLGATVAPAPGSYSPGAAIPVTGTTFEIDQIPPLAAQQQTNVGAAFSLQVIWPDGTVRGPYGPFTASDLPGPSRGTFSASIPGAATTGLTADASTNFQATVSIEVINASYTDALTGAWRGARAGSGTVTLRVPPATLIVENSFVSSVGWVKPGDTYPFRVFVKNFRTTSESSAVVTIPAPDGTTFTNATAVPGAGTCSINGSGSINWNIGTVQAAGPAGPTIKTCVVEATADTLGQDPQIVWKNLSSTATLTYAGGPTQASTSHGPKVIPLSATYDTARYGDRPFPVVPVDYFDREHAATHTGETLSDKINSPSIPGSTFNLYQEMSYQQLFPNGTVPSAGKASAGWDYAPGFAFTTPAPQGTCYGTSYKDVKNTALYPERIVNGWYQLPGDTAYYGADQFGSAVPGALAGIGPLLQIDNACGPTGKAVFDAANIADPEIDYSDYDTDKDGVVDFFMMVFVGIGGNGASQTSVPPYDNIWPHSSSLEFYYSNQGPYGQQGYVSDDQLKDLQGRPLYYTDASASTMTLTSTAFPVYVRVGPYNVNPESAIDNASVISHEYGHSLGLPDFYSLGDRETYGDWNLMATDKSQNMDVYSKQELGWLIPRVLPPGQTTATNWQDSKLNTHRIDWVDVEGNPYTLTGPDVNNGEAYVAKLPQRLILDPAKFDAAGPGEGATPSHVWWSQSGNDFGCTPTGAQNLDIFLPELATLPPGTTVTVTFKSYWDIEWDFDYGFVMISTDGGTTYTSLPSVNGYTEPTLNPNANACQQQYGNGITGASGSFEAGTQNVDRLLGQYPDGGFLTDSYDLSSAVGSATVLRFSYATDPGLARPGWFIDDLRITAGGNVIYETDFETSGDQNDPRVYPGGCKGTGRVAAICTGAWQYIDAAAGSPADHAYYMEMRDRSSFDLDGKDENDRDPIAFLPGLLLTYTDEAHGYGNVGTDNPPAQTPLDSQPQPGNDTPNLHDAAYTAAAGDNHFSDSGDGHTDNYTDPSNSEVDPNFPGVPNPWRFRFNCLTFDVLSMAGTDNGPGTVPPYDLTGDVQFTIGEGCAPFDYGNGVPNGAPTAIAQARPTTVNAGVPVTFDGSASFDDRQPANELTYEWDFDYDGTTFNVDATGQVAQHSYAAPGTYPAALRVTDAGGLSDTDSVTITVLAPPTRPTNTSVNCTPSPVQVGVATTCTATVADTGNGTPSTPSGTVNWSSNGSGSLNSANCTLSGSGNSASCSVTYTPSAVGSGTHVITASYSGDAAHATSSGSFNLTVSTQATRPTSTSVDCTPPSFTTGGSTTCTATVRDTGSGAKSAPTGTVSWSSSATGTFTPAGCTLTATGNPGRSSCSVSYTSTQVGTHTITATYGGDARHTGSSGATSVTVKACFDDDEGDDDDDFDDDCQRDDDDEDDDNDGQHDDDDDDDDNDGRHDDDDDDDDNDSISDKFDNEATRERSSSSSTEVAGDGQTEYIVVSDANTVLLTAVAADGLALIVEIYDPQGVLIGSSLPVGGGAIVTALPTSPGTYTVRVRNITSTTVTSLVTLIQSDLWP